ncbi:helix-turn-helix domain-containing protein [Pelagibacterium halotolerans]|uniref:helix-turn-helix domain-containing protein n=1 Tax=Pelagibacterium halotolerans TaxID=531813 RepID=UPI000896BA56|nr:helix-turn-helix domain-containing protein [Pelagibacterium halotolerans]QJR19631.1 helix-turn-helix domain-containing protein [Pelagibacterium halotolerans]SDZ86141.1 transcriptional regulator, AraC family [Pelagibacterium halotolerans]
MTLQISQAHENRLVPSLKFSTEAVPAAQQFEAWRAFNSMAELEPVTPPMEGFKASSASYHLGRLQMTSFQLAPMNISYTRDIQRKIGLDHWCLSVVTRGPVNYENNDNEVAVSPGHLLLHSYAAPFSGAMTNTHYSSLFFARDDYWDIAEHLERGSHQLVQGPMSHIVRDFMLSMIARADGLTMADASALNDAFGHLIRAMVINDPASLEAARAPIAAAQFDRARRFINANLQWPGLTPDAICANVGVSRRQMFYLFEQHGGVATYVRNRRLAACYSALVRADDGRNISSVAYEFGFTNLSSFYRQFSARFGFSPSEARAAAQYGRPPHSDEATFSDWLMRLSEI